MKGVTKRAVYFLGGFDPRGGRHYYSLFKEESLKMEAISDCSIKVSARQREKKYITKWDVEYTENDKKTHTEFRSLDYNDIVRNHWTKSKLGVIKDTIPCYLFLWKHNFFKNSFNVTKSIIIVIIAWFIFLVISLCVGALTWACSFIFITSNYNLNSICGVLLAFLTVFLTGVFFERKYNNYWLLRGINFSGMQLQYKDPDYEPRMKYFSDVLIAADLSDKYDEILIIGHSSGAIWASELVGRCLSNQTNFATKKASINLLTLGNCIPLITGSNYSSPYHNYLYQLSKSKKIDWVDISAKIDLAAVFDVDPLCALKKYPQEDDGEYRLPRFVPARFFRVFSDKGYHNLKKDLYRIHFQYLLASEKDGEYNYFRITSGPQILTEQFPILNN